MTLVKVCKTADVEEGHGKVVQAEGMAIALFRHKGRLFAIDNACPHMGGPLGEGELYEEDDSCDVICPLHGYMFNIKTGDGVNFPTGVKPYKVVVEGDDVLIEV